MARRSRQSQSGGGVRERKRWRQKRGEDDPRIPSRISYIEAVYARNATCTLYLERAKDRRARNPELYLESQCALAPAPSPGHLRCLLTMQSRSARARTLTVIASVLERLNYHPVTETAKSSENQDPELVWIRLAHRTPNDASDERARSASPLCFLVYSERKRQPASSWYPVSPGPYSRQLLYRHPILRIGQQHRQPPPKPLKNFSISALLVSCPSPQTNIVVAPASRNAFPLLIASSTAPAATPTASHPLPSKPAAKPRSGIESSIQLNPNLGRARLNLNLIESSLYDSEYAGQDVEQCKVQPVSYRARPSNTQGIVRYSASYLNTASNADWFKRPYIMPGPTAARVYSAREGSIDSSSQSSL
ncbi:hypothetical protein C8R44DRAFT_906596 [Mycena epipterygia]|nr:hypothetical protein C8R44DRAFT_906596 [Mycena epipterygia]